MAVDAPIEQALVERLLADTEGAERRMELGRVGCFTVLMAWMISGFVYVGVAAGGEYAAIERVVGFGCTGLSLVALVSMFVSIARARRTRHHLALDVRLASRVVRPGEDVTCSVRVFPIGPTELSRVEMTLIAQEITRFEEADEVSHEVYRTTSVLSVARCLPSDVPETIEGRLTIPMNAPGSFLSPHHDVSWEALVTVALPRAPKLERRLKLVVHPVSGQRSVQP